MLGREEVLGGSSRRLQAVGGRHRPVVRREQRRVEGFLPALLGRQARRGQEGANGCGGERLFHQLVFSRQYSRTVRMSPGTVYSPGSR